MWIGSFLVLLGVFTNISAYLKYAKRLEKLKNNDSLFDSKWSSGSVIALVLAIIGVVMIIYLFSF
jgi:uncharacterized membrane protein YidH (DUF202 family)